MAKCMKIGNVDIPAPAYEDGYEFSAESLDAASGTGRNKFNGKAFRQKICTKRTVSVKYNALRPAKIKQILDELDVESVQKKWIVCEVLNPRTNTLYSGTFYCASYKVALVSNSTGSEPIWSGLSFTLVEQ